MTEPDVPDAPPPAPTGPPAAPAPPAVGTAQAGPTPEPSEPPKPPGRFRAFWMRHRTLFWTLHSVWALTTGVVVLLLARERYGFVPWVVVFLALTWASTMFFGSRPTTSQDRAPGVGHELTSYVTRGLYQETLFFLLPFYAYSTVVGSANVAFLVLLGGLAIFSCLDLVFDRWLRTSPVFGLVFFATVAFAATNLLLPMAFGLRPIVATEIAALIAVGSAVPLAVKGRGGGRGKWLRLSGATAAILVVAIGLPGLVPPVPLRLDGATFGRAVQREPLALPDTIAGAVAAAQLAGRPIVVLAHVFAPSNVPTFVTLEWRRDGETIRTSREIEIVAHDVGFRVWDAWRPEDGRVPPGRYRVILRTRGQRVFGVANLTVTP